MDAPDDPDLAARRAAIQDTAGSAVEIFAPDYLKRLRQDWPD